MKTQNHSLSFAALLAAGGLCTSALAQTTGGGQSVQPVPSAASAAGEMTTGEVRKVDKEARKITLRHGEIKNLEMPGMTMVFQVKDPTILDAVKVGDKVRFKAERIGGAIVVTDLQPAP